MSPLLGRVSPGSRVPPLGHLWALRIYHGAWLPAQGQQLCFTHLDLSCARLVVTEHVQK